MSLFNTDNKTKPKGDAKTDKAKSASSMKDLYDNSGTAVKEAKTESKQSKQNRAYMILVKPIITEKATVIGQFNKYAFEVSLNANKVEVAKAIEEAYGVRPERVNIIRIEGKRKNMGRISGKRKDWKKAIVTMPAGKTIQLYEGV